MKGLQYAIDLVDRTFGTTIRKSKKHTKGLDDAVKKADRNIFKLGKTGKRGFGDITRYAKRAAGAVGLVFALNSAIAFGGQVEAIGAKFQGFENAINFASGADGARNISFLNKQIKDLSLDMTGAYQGFQTLSGSMLGTKLQGQGVRDIYEGIAIASRVMNLTGEQTQGTFLAVSQIASKGIVSMEELRQQLAERIPGALKIAADAMNMPLQQFNKIVESGRLTAEVFLPRFAKAMKERFAGGVAVAVNSLQASKDRSNNAFTQMQIGMAASLEKSFIAWNNFKVRLFAGILQLFSKLKVLKTSFFNLLDSFTPLIQAVKGLGSAIGGTEGFLNGLKTAIDTIAPVIKILATGLGTIIDFLNPMLPLLGAVAAGWWAINIAMYANPIGLVIVAIVALVGVVTHAWQKVGWFRGGIMAAWTAIKGFGMAIKTAVIDRFKEMLAGMAGIAKAVKFLFQGEISKAFDAASNARDKLFSAKTGQDFVKNMKGVGKDAADALYDGVHQARNNKLKPSLFNMQGLVPNSANTKLLGGGGLGTTGNGKVSGASGTTASVAGSGGTTNKHTVFNIKSMVENLTVQTTTISGGANDVKRQLEKIFLELMGDLELRANS